MTNKSKELTKKVKNPDKFLLAVLLSVKQNGYVVDRESNSMYWSISMEYKCKDLKANTYAYCHCMGNGSCEATILYKGEKVFDGNGCFTSAPFDSKINTYIPGKWEKLMGLKAKDSK